MSGKIFIIIYIINYILSICIIIKWIKIGMYNRAIDIDLFLFLNSILMPLNIIPFFLPILLKFLSILDFYNKPKKYKIKFNENMRKINDKYNE